jgi:hypothetical protein
METSGRHASLLAGPRLLPGALAGLVEDAEQVQSVINTTSQQDQAPLRAIVLPEQAQPVAEDEEVPPTPPAESLHDELQWAELFGLFDAASCSEPSAVPENESLHLNQFMTITEVPVDVRSSNTTRRTKTTCLPVTAENDAKD